MITLDTIKLLYNYNNWANERVLKACEDLTPEQWDKAQGYSWGSVHGMVVHIMAAEIAWFSRWKGVSPKSLVKAEEFPTLADVRHKWGPQREAMRWYLDDLTQDQLNSNLTYTKTNGEPEAQPLAQLMLHLFNHGTHHRGELSAMLALMNIPHEEEDLLIYLRQKG